MEDNSTEILEACPSSLSNMEPSSNMEPNSTEPSSRNTAVNRMAMVVAQQYTHTSAPPNVTYAPSVSSYASYDSSYQQPRTTGTHTTSPYTDASNPYGGDTMDYQQTGTYPPQTAGQTSLSRRYYATTRISHKRPCRIWPNARDKTEYHQSA